MFPFGEIRILSDLETDRRAAFRQAIEGFLAERLQEKLESIGVSSENEAKGLETRSKYAWTAWLDDAARRAAQIQAVTHTLKATHPYARGTSLHCRPDGLPARHEVGSHVLGKQFVDDVVGNAAALDVYKFLRIQVLGRSLLEAMCADDADLKRALSDDPEQASAWIVAFTTLLRPRESAASHAYAKQLYWLSGNDPLDNGNYHILSPLYASSLAHAVFQRIQRDRFGEEAITARQARRNGAIHPTGYSDYAGLAVQKLGGTKPQNVSQLNSERGGNNYLLSCAPPRWKQQGSRPPLRRSSAFVALRIRSREIRDSLNSLRLFLERDPAPRLETRQHRELLFGHIVDHVIQQSALIQQNAAAGWSSDNRCRLPEAERLWLDPYRTRTDAAFHARWCEGRWKDDVANAFALWVNDELGSRLPMGDAEHQEWKRTFSEDLAETFDALLPEIEQSAPAGPEERQA